MAHPPGTGPAASHSGNGGLRVAHARPLRRRTAGLGQTSRQYRTGVDGVIEKLRQWL